MEDFANLVVGFDTSGLKKGEKALADTTKAAGATEGKLRNASGQFLKAGESADTASRSLDGFGSTTGQVRDLALEAGKAVAALAIGFFSIQTAFQAFGDANSLNLALAETNTLLSGLPGEIDLVATSARNLADAYGTSDEEQVRAFYQAFSAGSKDAAEATKLLQAANMLAIGGVTDVTTGVDALSTVVNAFGSDVITAAEASDSLFVAMKAGKTTIEELSASLGQIVPIAAASGVSFDETAAAIAALTTQGLSTSSATTGLRAILSSIIAPTDGAAKAASALGLEFSTQAIKAKGFSGFLDDVIDKTGGSETVIAELFGSVEALGAVLAFSAGAGDKFADILVDMEDKAGSAALAMDAIDASAADRLGDAFQSISNTFTRLAENSLPMAAAAAEVLASSISFVAGSGEALVAVSEILAVVLAGLAVSQIPALVTAFVALTAGLTATGIATTIFTSIVTAARLALIALGGPLGLVYGILGSGAAAWVLWADNTKEGETAIDNVTLAMGDNIKQANSLFTLMGTGQTITQSAALAKLSEAEAHLRTADALREERDAVLSLQQAQLTLNYQRETEALNSIRAGTDAYEEREQSIVRILSNMGDLQAIQQSANGDFAAATAEVERIRKAIGNAVDGMVTFDGEVITAIDLGNRLATAITNISFDNAISGASFLANDLGVNIELANKFNATLDRSAGIEAPKPAAGGTRGLGFGLGNADTGAIQSVTLAYGDLSGSAKEVDAAIKRLSSTNIQAEKTLSSVSSAISGGGAKSGLTPALTDAEKATQSYADTMQGFVVDGIGKAVDNMVDGFTGGLKSIKDIFVATIKQMISFAIKNKIMLSLGMGGSAMGTAASAATGGAGGLGGSLAGIGSLGSVFAGSLSGTASAFMSGGIGAGIGQIGATLGAVTGSLGSLAAAAGAIALPLLAVVGVFKFFGKSTKLLDQGLQLTVKGMNSVVESFSKTKTSRFFGLSSRTSTSTSQLDAAAASPLTNAIDGIQKSVLSAAAGLGIGADAFSKFSFGFKLSLNGLTEEQKMSAVTAELAKMGDAFAAVVPGISSLNELLAVSAERYNLQNRVLELQGKGEELLARQRKAQMNATNDLNKAILKQIFNLEDASIAQEKTNALAEEAAQAAAQAQAALFSSINENDFATGVDFRRGLARASSGIEYSPQQSQAEMLAELKALNARIDMLQSTSEITANSSRQTAENTDFSNALTLDAAA